MLGRSLRVGLVGLALGCVAEAAQANNCRYLEMQLMQLQGSSGRADEIRDVRAMLRQRGCTGERPAASSNRGGNSFGWGQRSEEPARSSAREPSRASRDASPSSRSTPTRQTARSSGTYRTLCVRRCDGYYFPISFSTSRQHLPVDEATCAQLCPAGDAELYYHSARSEGPEQMRSVAGEYYTDLENAFRYRDVLDEACTCGTPLATPPIASDSAVTAAAAPSAARLPRYRPPQGIDPETTLNRLGELSYEATRQAEVSASVRVILPPWYTMDSGVMLSPVPN